jgi:hypothetical protein
MESKELDIGPKKYKNRWVSYFDLLGFRKLVEQRDLSFIIKIYDEILNDLQIKTSDKKKYGIDYSWFSDTFIIFAKDDTKESFSLIEQASRLFFQRLILRHIPLRGALTVGELYTQKEKNIFLGKGLIDAYLYGEKWQNWIGFILTPRVFELLKNTDLNIEKLRNYHRIEDHNIIRKPDIQNIFAFTMCSLNINDRNECLQAIQYMKNHVEQEYKEKYQNTENFILSCMDL